LSIVAEAMLSRVLEEAVNRVARKVAEDKKLSDQEIVDTQPRYHHED